MMTFTELQNKVDGIVIDYFIQADPDTGLLWVLVNDEMLPHGYNTQRQALTAILEWVER